VENVTTPEVKELYILLKQEGFLTLKQEGHTMSKIIIERLLDIIEQIPEEDRLELMEKLKKKPSERKRRKHHREPFLLVVDYSINNRFYKDFLCNISIDGVFIETKTPFDVGKEVSMTFQIHKKGQPLKVTGTVARISSKGIGIKFKEVHKSDALKSLVKWLRE